MKTIVRTAGVFCLFVACAAWAAIDRGSIRGSVTDPQGAFVPGVHVTITNLDTGVQQTTQTDSAGFYLVTELVPGTYKVHFDMMGFTSTDVVQIQVKPNEVTTVDMQLKIGATAQHVEVTAAAAVVDTTTTSYGTVVGQAFAMDLPMVGRDIQGLINLVPGVTSSIGPPGTLAGFNGGQFGGFPDPSHFSGSYISVNGGQISQNGWYLDGSFNQAQEMDNAVVSPPPDTVAEFQMVNNAIGAEYGRSGGGIVSVVLKSGSNAVHGDLYEFNRNSYFSATNPFAPVNPYGKPLPPNPVNWNQFGGTVGGPVFIPHVYNGKNRTFFFAAWDTSILHETGIGLYSIPTLLEHQANFSDFPGDVQYGIFDPMTTKYSSALGTFVRQPFLNPNGTVATTLPAGRLDPVAEWFMGQYPSPNFLDPRQQNAAAGGCLNTCNNYQGNYGNAQDTDTLVAKVDHQIGEKHKLFVEYLYNPTDYSFTKLPWPGATVPFTGFNGANPWRLVSQLATFGETSAFSPTLVNEFRFTYSRQNHAPAALQNKFLNTNQFLSEIAGLNLPVTTLAKTPSFQVGYTGGSGEIAIGSNVFGYPTSFLQIMSAATVLDNLTKVKGKHTIKTGFVYRNDIEGQAQPNTTVVRFGSLSCLTCNAVTGAGGNGMAQFLLGAVDQGSGSGGSFKGYTTPTYGSSPYWGFYAQDDYRVTPKLTLNYGLRYELFGWWSARFNNGNTPVLNIPNPQDPVRLGAIVYFGTPQHPSDHLAPAKKTDFAPRLNFAYTPFSDRKTIIRGGVDLMFTDSATEDRGVGAWINTGFQQNQDWTEDATGQGLAGRGVTPSFILSHGAPPLPPLVNPRTTDYQGMGSTGSQALSAGIPPFPRDPNVWIWNLQVQRQLTNTLSLSVGYVGLRGTHIFGGGSWNWDRLPYATELKYKSQLNTLVQMPTDLAPLWGSQDYMSQELLPWPQWNTVYPFNVPVAWNKYNSLQMKVEKRASHGISFVAAYTWQKNISSGTLGAEVSNIWDAAPGWAAGRGRLTTFSLNSPQSFDFIKEDHSIAADDTPNILNLGLIYDLPFGPGKALAPNVKSFARELIGGWKLSGNLNTQSGTPMEIGGPGNNLTGRVNMIGNPNAGRSGKSRYNLEQQWFNPNAFEAVFGSDPTAIALATTGTPAQKDAYDVAADRSSPFWRLGTAGRFLDNARAPGFFNIDTALMKDFRITESKYVEFRWDLYNALNHQNLGTPNTGWCLGPNADGTTDAVHQFGCSFGRITSVQTDPRNMQFGLKFVF